MTQNLKNKLEEIEEKLENLEEVFEFKMKQNIFIEKIDDNSNLELKVIEQEKIIQNLNEELNNAQKIIKEIGKENDFLKDKNRFFADKIFKLKSQGSKLVLLIEEDLERLKEIIKTKLK